MKSENKKEDFYILKNIFNKIDLDEARLLKEVICQDPFQRLYKKALIIYAIMLFLILLWPFNFNFKGIKNNVKWCDVSPGINLMEGGQVISGSISKEFYNKITKGEGLSVEVWITPKKNQFVRPSRIISYSLNRKYRNFTVAQQGPKLIIALRTEKTNLNGTKPMLIIDNIFKYMEPIHIVICYNYKEQSVFVNGSINTTSVIPGCDFKNWNPDNPLILGNEATGDCPWFGKIFYAAIYNHPLNSQEVRRSYNNIKSYLYENIEIDDSNKGPIVRYLLNEKKGNEVTDTGTLAESQTLNIPDKIKTKGKPFLSFSLKRLPDWGTELFNEILLNVLLFIPLGFLFHAIIKRYIEGNWIVLFFVVIVCGAITLTAEILQYFDELRHSSSVDIFANLIGALLGVQINRVYYNMLKRNKKNVCII